MKNLLCRLIATMAVFVAFAQLATAQVATQPRAKPKDSALIEIENDPSLPNVLLIGDSISINYTLAVRRLLAGIANVHRPLENCDSTHEGLQKLDQWLGDRKWSVIHFNWGLHDIKFFKNGKLDVSGTQVSSPEVYEKNLRELVRRLKATGARLVWASTTPVPPGAEGRRSEDVDPYNTIAARIMKENGIPINDLNRLAREKCATLHSAPNDVHFKPEGARILAAQVAQNVLMALESDQPTTATATPAR